MKCHAIHCQNEPIPGMLMCYDHWMMLPAKVRESRGWVRPAGHNETFRAEMPLNESRVERGQMELFG